MALCGTPCCQQAQDKFHGNPHVADDRLATEDVGRAVIRLSNSCSVVIVLPPNRRRARLLLARFIHSRGSSGGKRSGSFIDHLAFPQRGFDDQRVAVLVALDVSGRNDKGVNGNADPAQIPVYLPHQVKRVHAFLDNEQVHVAVSVHLTAGGGPEQDDLFRLGYLDDTRRMMSSRIAGSSVVRGFRLVLIASVHG